MDFAKLNDSVFAVISIEDVFSLRVSGCDHLEREIAIGYHRRPGFLLARLHRFQRLKVSISLNRTHCAALSIDFLSYSFASKVLFVIRQKENVCSTTYILCQYYQS